MGSAPMPLRVIRNTLILGTSLHVFVDYVGYPALTEGPSMLPTLAVQGDMVWVSTRYRRGRGIVAGDVVSFRHPWFPEEMASKRILAMPGDFVLRDTPRSMSAGQAGPGEDSRIARLQQAVEGFKASDQQMMIQVPEGHCWLAGDNSPWSRDSRDYGPLPLSLIRGKTSARIWPLSRAGWIENILHAARKQ